MNANKLRQSIPDIVKYLYNKKSVDDKEWVCRTCHNHLIKNRVPSCAIANGMVFPEKPDFFDLNELECRLLAPRIAFQKLMQAPRGRQLKIYGNIVNVPADVTNTVSMLPRRLSQIGAIKVNLKRKLQYKSSAMSLNVRPYKVVQAANWLMINSSLYRNEGILLLSIKMKMVFVINSYALKLVMKTTLYPPRQTMAMNVVKMKQKYLLV